MAFLDRPHHVNVNEAEHDWLAETSESEIDREIVSKGGLRGFVSVAWDQLEPAKYVHNWHVEEISEHLEAVTKRQIRRLIINIPPGCMKSLLVSVMWPAWVWTLQPEHKWIFASYEASLSLRDARKMRNLVESAWWRMRWPDVFLPHEKARSVREFDNNEGGFRFSTSVSGGVTGRHGDTQVADDPLRPLDIEGGRAATGVKIEENKVWWKGTMPTRMADPQTSARVIVMQRLHEKDLTGEMLAEGAADGEKYEHLCLPMRFEVARKSVTIIGGDRRTKEGELLWPERFPEAEVARLERELGSQSAAAQLQQSPSPTGGGVFKVDWVKHWGMPGTEFPNHPPLKEMHVIQSWDCTFKGLNTSDYVVGQVWGFWKVHAFLLDQVRGQWSFTETCAALEKLSAKWPKGWVKYVEDKANGPAVVNVMKDKVPGLKLVNPEGGKEARANAVQPIWEGGNVWLPHPTIAPWVGHFEHELTIFPAGAHDDQVDAMTQALLPFATGNRLEELRRAMQNR